MWCSSSNTKAKPIAKHCSSFASARSSIFFKSRAKNHQFITVKVKYNVKVPLEFCLSKFEYVLQFSLFLTYYHTNWAVDVRILFEHHARSLELFSQNLPNDSQDFGFFSLPSAFSNKEIPRAFHQWLVVPDLELTVIVWRRLDRLKGYQWFNQFHTFCLETS